MRSILKPVFDAIPESAATPLTVAAGVAAAAGTGLVLLATAYGDWVPAAWSGGTFVLAGLLWHGSDHASNG